MFADEKEAYTNVVDSWPQGRTLLSFILPHNVKEQAIKWLKANKDSPVADAVSSVMAECISKGKSCSELKTLISESESEETMGVYSVVKEQVLGLVRRTSLGEKLEEYVATGFFPGMCVAGLDIQMVTAKDELPNCLIHCSFCTTLNVVEKKGLICVAGKCYDDEKVAVYTPAQKSELDDSCPFSYIEIPNSDIKLIGYYSKCARNGFGATSKTITATAAHVDGKANYVECDNKMVRDKKRDTHIGKCGAKRMPGTPSRYAIPVVEGTVLHLADVMVGYNPKKCIYDIASGTKNGQSGAPLLGLYGNTWEIVVILSSSSMLTSVSTAGAVWC